MPCPIEKEIPVTDRKCNALRSMSHLEALKDADLPVSESAASVHRTPITAPTSIRPMS